MVIGQEKKHVECVTSHKATGLLMGGMKATIGSL